MARRFNPRIVGAFVLAATALGVAAAIYLGSNQVFQRKVRFAVVFQQDLAGLDPDAPVKFRGVPVGRVASIHLSIGSPREPLKAIYMPVVIELHESRIREMGESTDLGNPEVVKELVQNGLRARLALESYLSLRRYVDLDIMPDAPPASPPPFPLPYPVIPVYVEPGLAALQADVSKALAKLMALDLDGLVADLRRAAKAFEHTAATIDRAGESMPRTMAAMDQALGAIRDAARALETQVPGLAGDARTALQRLTSAMEQMDRTVREVKVAMDPGAPVPAKLEKALDEAAAAARALRLLAESLERDPGQIVRGRSEVKP
jgi:paraquat-inducible protein B